MSAPLPDAGFSVLRVFAALSLVLALFLGGVWIFKNWRRFAHRNGPAPRLQILEMRALGQRHALYVVGYDQQRLLVAASPSGVTLVSHLPPADANSVEPKLASGSADNPRFVETLQQMLQRNP